MIVGTAGHIDHGKTALVHALTGVDTDRLPEEKRRGISIELGYAFLDGPGATRAERIGFIDVPGHERLLHTMIAGATGIDYALLLVAADDGVMPQTREHVAVLSLLGLTRGLVAITKIDRVDAARVDAVRAEVSALLQGTSLAGAELLAVSAHSGAGVEALRARLLAAAAASAPRRDDSAAFRLAIDRAFTLDGVGTVVTGTVHAGCVSLGDELVVTPSARPLSARVRSLHAQNRAVTQALAGERCAVALAGVAKHELARGQWLTRVETALATQRLDAVVSVWRDEAVPLRSGTSLHVHLGAASVMGSVAVLHRLEGGDAAPADTLPPGARGLVQLVLREALGAWRGDRLVLRDASATRTLAGGCVLDPFAPARYRRKPQRLAELAAWSQAAPPSRLAALLAAATQGLNLSRWAAAEGWVRGAAASVPEGTLQAHDAGAAAWALGAAHADAVGATLLKALRAFHAQHPEELGPDASRLRRLAAPRLPEALWRALVARLQASGEIAVRGSFVHLHEHGLRLSASDERLAQALAPSLTDAGFEGCWARDLARESHVGEALVRTTLARLAQRGELHQVVKDLYYPDATMIRLAALARDLAAASAGEVKAADFRDATGLGRKRAIQLLEYLDRVGLLRRVGDAHRLRSDTAVFAEPAP